MSKEVNCVNLVSDIRYLNFIYFNDLYELFYRELISNESKYKAFLRNKLILFRNDLKYNYFNKYRVLKNEVKDRKKLLEIINKDIEIIDSNRKSWKDIVYDIKPLLYVFVEIIKDFSCFDKMKKIIDDIIKLNSKLITYFIKKNQKPLRHFTAEEMKNILVLALTESIYKYDPFFRKRKGNFEYGEGVLFSGVAYNYMKKNIIDEIIERIHIASLTIEEKLKYIEYYKNTLLKNNGKNENGIEQENESVEFNYSNNYISLDEYIDDDNEKTKMDLIRDERNEYTKVEQKILIEKLLDYLTPEELYSIYYMKNEMKHDEEVMNILGLNIIRVTANQIRYPIMAKKAMEKIKGLI